MKTNYKYMKSNSKLNFILLGAVFCLVFVAIFSFNAVDVEAQVNYYQGGNLNCVSYSYKKCNGTAVYWYDSCNNMQDLYQSCTYGQICSGSTCINQNLNINTGTTYSNNSNTNTGTNYSNTTNNNTTNNNYVLNYTRGCFNNVSYWYDSTGNRQGVYQNCSLTGQTCQDGQCIGSSQNSSSNNTNTSSSTETNTTSNTTNNTTLNQNPTNQSAYALHYVTKCYENNIYWYDSNDQVKDLFVVCSDSNSCTQDSCGEAQCKNELKCDGSTCATNSQDFARYCASTAGASVASSPFLNFLKKWYLWILLIIVLVVVFIFIFRRLSSSN
ncbi:MAG: hypothetical protein FJZ43_01850 [Candidatus Staskawiczbacteria bacterium]|nr:hypothetical protein [Candidatus Staskawiczbacteria bacterium]